MDKSVVGGIVRTVLASGAGFLVGKGYITEDMVEPLIGGVIAIGVAVWSFVQKKGASKKLEAAKESAATTDTATTPK